MSFIGATICSLSNIGLNVAPPVTSQAPLQGRAAAFHVLRTKVSAPSLPSIASASDYVVLVSHASVWDVSRFTLAGTIYICFYTLASC